MNYRAWEIEPVDPRTASDRELLLNLVGWAILAPNSHNVQPWKFVVHDRRDIKRIEIYIPDRGVLPASDPSAREAYISIGCAIENMKLAADYYGLKTGTIVWDYSTRRLAFSLLVCQRGTVDPQKKVWLEAMKNRRMNRGLYDEARAVPEEVIAGIRSYAAEQGAEFDAVTGKTRRWLLAKLQSFCDGQAIKMDSFRKELADYLLPNDTASGVGMPGNTFGLPDPAAVYVHEELKKDCFDKNLAKNFSAAGYAAFKSAPLVGVVSVYGDSPAEWMLAGQVLQRAALLAEQRGLAMAVHAAMVEVGPLNLLLRALLLRRARPMAIFRMGYATETRPHAPRMNVAEVVEIIE